MGPVLFLKIKSRKVQSVTLLFLILISMNCGYKASGKYSGLPEHVHRVAIPVFKNNTLRFELAKELTDAVRQEFISRSEFQITEREDNADAVLYCEINSYQLIPLAIKQQNVGSFSKP